MFVTSINVRREGYYGAGYGKADPAKPFNTTVELHGQQGKIELVVSPELSARIVEIIADEVAAAGRAAAEAMTASFVNLPQLEQVA
jgi:hypothetical protein